MNKILSISVAAYNSEKWIGKCLDSFIIPEIIDKIEVLIVNDGSTDRTREISKLYEHQYPNLFKLIDKENGGHGSTINVAILKASGLYFKIVDSDDWVDRNGMINLISVLEKNDVDVVLSPYYTVDNITGKRVINDCVPDYTAFCNKIVDVGELNNSCKIAMQAITYRAEMLRNNFCQIDEDCFYVDLEYLVFYFRHVRKVMFTDVPVYHYTIGTVEQSVNLENMIKRRDQHKRVCDRLLTYSTETNCKHVVIQSIIEICVLNHYRILMSIENQVQSKEELICFDRDLKIFHPDIYYNIIIRGKNYHLETAIAVRILRLLRFHGYSIFHYAIRKLK